jgi:hypothetical protein
MFWGCPTLAQGRMLIINRIFLPSLFCNGVIQNSNFLPKTTCSHTIARSAENVGQAGSLTIQFLAGSQPALHILSAQRESCV